MQRVAVCRITYIRARCKRSCVDRCSTWAISTTKSACSMSFLNSLRSMLVLVFVFFAVFDSLTSNSFYFCNWFMLRSNCYSLSEISWRCICFVAVQAVVAVAVVGALDKMTVFTVFTIWLECNRIWKLKQTKKIEIDFKLKHINYAQK